MIAYAGFPAATNALMTAQALFQEADAPQKPKKAAK
jgi:hypothetical protein